MRVRGDENGERHGRPGCWRLQVNEGAWDPRWWPLIEDRLAGDTGAFSTSRHARTFVLMLPVGGGALRAFLKVYHQPDRRTAWKDRFRSSKAARAARMSRALAADGFHVPPVLAVGERRAEAAAPHAFLLTRGIEAPTLAEYARVQAGRVRPGERRTLLCALGRTVGEAHATGYVFGDLLVTNILVQEGPPPCFWLIDHDRSRRVVRGEGEHWRARNLVQLNRLPVDGTSHSDRLRVFLAYAAARSWGRTRSRATARRLAAATARRRRALAAGSAGRRGR